MHPVAQRKLLGLIGLGVRGRGAIVGVEQVRQAAKRNQLAFAVVAPDASPHSRSKVLPLLTGRRIEYVEGPSAAVLGAAVGREAAAVVGILDPALARGIRAAIGTTGNGNGEEGGSGVTKQGQSA